MAKCVAAMNPASAMNQQPLDCSGKLSPRLWLTPPENCLENRISSEPYARPANMGLPFGTYSDTVPLAARLTTVSLIFFVTCLLCAVTELVVGISVTTRCCGYLLVKLLATFGITSTNDVDVFILSWCVFCFSVSFFCVFDVFWCVFPRGCCEFGCPYWYNQLPAKTRLPMWPVMSRVGC